MVSTLASVPVAAILQGCTIRTEGASANQNGMCSLGAGLARPSGTCALRRGGGGSSNSGYSKDAQLMHLVRCLFFAPARDISLYACHIPGVLNTVADAISRDLSLLFSKVPDADYRPSVVPGELVELLVSSQPDWTLPSWRLLFGSCLQQV